MVKKIGSVILLLIAIPVCSVSSALIVGISYLNLWDNLPFGATPCGFTMLISGLGGAIAGFGLEKLEYRPRWAAVGRNKGFVLGLLFSFPFAFFLFFCCQ